MTPEDSIYRFRLRTLAWADACRARAGAALPLRPLELTLDPQVRRRMPDTTLRRTSRRHDCWGSGQQRRPERPRRTRRREPADLPANPVWFAGRSGGGARG